jgi:hypothetical protein
MSLDDYNDDEDEEIVCPQCEKEKKTNSTLEIIEMRINSKVTRPGWKMVRLCHCSNNHSFTVE